MNPHPERGSCPDSACPWSGVCHCGCGEPTGIASQNRSVDNGYGVWTKGRPMMWANGMHSPKALHGVEPAVAAAGARLRDQLALTSGRIVPVGKVRPLAKWLQRRCRSVRVAAQVAGVAHGTLNNVIYSSRSKYVEATTAQAIIAAVLACKTPTDPWTEFDARRPPTEWERVKSRRYQEAEEQRSNRAKRAKRQEAS